MRFCSAYLWEKGEERVHNPVSLVLQQVEVRKQSVMLACVCRGRAEKDCDVAKGNDCCEVGEGCDEVEISGYFTEALVEWFHRECLKIVERKSAEAELERSLYKEIEIICGELAQYSKKKGIEVSLDCVGMLLVEQRFLLFSMGKGQAFLLNRRYNRKHMRCIVETSAFWQGNAFGWESGLLQKRLGILLGVEDILEQVEADMVTEVLIGEEFTEERLQKRVRELWEEQGKSVIYFRTY